MTATAQAPSQIGEVPTFEVRLKVRRYLPPEPAQPLPYGAPAPQAEAYWEEFTVRVHGTDRVLDALHKVKWEQDGSLTFRRSCAHGVCGSDAMRINGRNRLACKTLLKDLDPTKPITIEPIKGLSVLKDLVVDMEPFFASYREIMPFLVTSGNEPTRERLQSPEQRARYDDTTKCILCACCTSSCPILNDKEGVWRCRTTFNCTEACPRGIEVTKAIAEVKRAMITRAY